MSKNKSVSVAEEIVLTDGEEITVADVHADEISDVLLDLETEEGKREAYAAQPAETTAEGVSAVIVEGVASATAGKVAKAPRTPRLSLIGSSASSIVASHAAAMGGLLLERDGDTMEASAEFAFVDALDKKTREKAVNLVHSMASNKRPSVYTVQAVKALREHGTLSLKTLTDYYMVNCGYKPGTARRQASEMFALFPAFKIASKEAGKGTPLVLNHDSVVLMYVEAASMTVTAAPDEEELAA